MLKNIITQCTLPFAIAWCLSKALFIGFVYHYHCKKEQKFPSNGVPFIGVMLKAIFGMLISYICITLLANHSNQHFIIFICIVMKKMENSFNVNFNIFSLPRTHSCIRPLILDLLLLDVMTVAKNGHNDEG